MDTKKSAVVRLDDLKNEVLAAVKDMQLSDPALFAQDPEIVFLKDPGIVGFLVPLDQVQGKPFGKVAGLAEKVGASLGGPGGLVIHDRNIIVGFMPPLRQFDI